HQECGQQKYRQALGGPVIQLTDLSGGIRRCELRESGKYRQAEWKDHGKERTGETMGQHVTSERIELQPLTENQLVGLGEDRSYKCDRAHSTCESPKTSQIGILEGCSVRVRN